MRAADKSLYTGLQVIKAHGEMARVRPIGSSLIPHGENIPDRQQAQTIEADQWRLLGEFIEVHPVSHEFGRGRDHADLEWLAARWHLGA